MAEVIVLALQNRGNRIGGLSIKAKDYIDRNHKGKTYGEMAQFLNLTLLRVINYCNEKGFTPPANPVKQPKKVKTSEFFSVEDYLKDNISI